MLGVICSRTQTFLASSIILPHFSAVKYYSDWLT